MSESECDDNDDLNEELWSRLPDRPASESDRKKMHEWRITCHAVFEMMVMEGYTIPEHIKEAVER